jgi:hypothetical protein
MVTKKSVSQMFSVLLILMLLLTGVLPVQAESLASSLNASGDFIWAKSMGGMGGEKGYSIAVDSSGNVYTIGYFAGTADFDPGVGTASLTSAGFNDIFISKLDSSGDFAWAKSMGGAGNDVGIGLTVDSSGNAYMTGFFEDTADFDPGAGTANLASAGDSDIFVSKLNSNGGFVWAKRMGGTSHDWGIGSILDSSGNVYTTGYFADIVDFDPGTGTTNLTSAGLEDIFISKLNNSGNFVWARGMGGAGSDWGIGVAIDSSDNVHTTGYFASIADFDPGTGIINLTSAGNSDIFASKLDGSGNFIWAKRMGGTGDDWGSGITVDSSGSICMAGFFEDTADFDPGTGIANLASAGLEDVFVSKLNSSGNFVWAKRMGGVNDDKGYSIAVDLSGNIYTTGYFAGIVDFDPNVGTANLTSAGLEDIFVSKLDGNGDFGWAKRMGGTSNDEGIGIIVDLSGNVYTTGSFWGTVDFDPGAGTINLTSAGLEDIFVSKLDNSSTFVDVPLDHPLYKYIEALYDAGFTAGCSTSPMMFCPDTILDRAQSAVFMLRGQLGSGYTPPPAPWTNFVNESWVGFEWAQGWAEGMYIEGLTSGCQTSPLKFCPANQLPRVEASIFGLKMKYGVSYLPPPASGTLFADFPSTDPSYWGIDWAEKAYVDGLLPACGTDSVSGKPMFCPGELVNRGWGAYLIVKAKNLPTP